MDSVENPPGVWQPEGVQEKAARGDILRAKRSFVESSESSNDDLQVDNQISIIMNPFINENLDRLRYVTLYGNKWKVKSIELVRPRMILTIGGLYNG